MPQLWLRVLSCPQPRVVSGQRLVQGWVKTHRRAGARSGARSLGSVGARVHEAGTGRGDHQKGPLRPNGSDLSSQESREGLAVTQGGAVSAVMLMLSSAVQSRERGGGVVPPGGGVEGERGVPPPPRGGPPPGRRRSHFGQVTEVNTVTPRRQQVPGQDGTRTLLCKSITPVQP